MINEPKKIHKLSRLSINFDPIWLEIRIFTVLSIELNY